MFINSKHIKKVSEDFTDTRIDYWLKKNFPSFHYFFLCKLIRKGFIKINGKKCTQRNILKKGDFIRIPDVLLESNSESEYKIPVGLAKLVKTWIIYKDRDTLIINKPNGLAVQGGTKVKLNLDLLLDTLKFTNSEKPRIIHRLDKDTSGLLLLARNLKSAKYLSSLFQQKKIHKLYLAITYGEIHKNYEKLESNIFQNGKIYSSLTYYWKLKSNKKFSLLIIRPITGRKHQIRKHLLTKKLQILGDKKYFIHKNDELNNSKILNLHALYFGYKNISGEIKQFTADLPLEFINNLKKYDIEIDSHNIELDNYLPKV